MTAPKLLPPADPYDHTDERNHLAVHRPNERALAENSKLGAMLLGKQSEFAAVAKAAGLPAERLVLELVAVARKNPAILECTEDSIMTFMFDAAKLGLTIGRGVFPVPVNNRRANGGRGEKRLEAWVGYKGSKELAMTTGAIRDCWAEIHFEGDVFEFERAPVPVVRRHVSGPHFNDMSKALGVYATILFPGNITRSKYLTRDDVDKLRKKSRSDTTSAASPWVTNPREMWQAKAMLQITKDLPQNARLAHLQSVQARFDEAAPLDAPAPMAQLPAGEPVTEGQFEPVEETAAAPTMSLGEASAIGITTKGGHARMLGEMRNSGVEAVLTWARAGLEQDPDAQRLQRIAVGCTTVLEARAAGLAKEPPKQEGN